MRCFCRDVVAAGAGVALLSLHGALAASPMFHDCLDKEHGVVGEVLLKAEEFAEATGTDAFKGKVAEIQGIPESDIKVELRGLYSPFKEAQEKQLFPPGSLESMQDALNKIAPLDDDGRDVVQYLNRFAYLMAQLLKKYNEFYKLKVSLGELRIAPEEYGMRASKLPKVAMEWTSLSNLLVAFLTIGANDLRDKWEGSATAERRLRETLGFFGKLIEVYEAQMRLFRTAYALTKLRYLENPEGQTDLTLLLEDPRQKSAQSEFDDAMENIKEKTHRARKAAKFSVDSGIIPEEYMTLLPFGPDKQREADDIPQEDL